jgi:ABC-type dipeptide/oligopeptide/nickel transport system permease component
MHDTQNILVLAIFAGSLIAIIAGYLFAWRSKGTVSRKAGSLMVAAVAGFAGLVMSAWLMGVVMPLPPPNGEPLWHAIVPLVVLSPLPLGAFYFCAKFIRQALRTDVRAR